MSLPSNLLGTDVPVVFLSYHEPNAFANLSHLRETMRVDALQVHGVKGLDAAHKAASELARSINPNCPVFFTVDSDNQVLPQFNEFRTLPLVDLANRLPFDLTKGVVSFRAVNAVNGSCYGNGGVKLWSHEFVAKMQTHEASVATEGPLDFCELPNYMHHPAILSRTLPNGDPTQAFRAGYREGAKLLLMRDASALRSLDDFTFRTVNQWASIGADVRYGGWCCIGTVYGIHDGLFNKSLARELLLDHDKVAAKTDKIFPAYVAGYGSDTTLGHPITLLGEAYPEFLETYCQPLVRSGHLLGVPFSNRRSYWMRHLVLDALGVS